MLRILSALSVIAFLSMALSSCGSDVKASEPGNGPQGMAVEPASGEFTLSQAWKDYWYAGVAEVTTYSLQQGRYRDSHPGTAVNIFVTEDLSASKQVKLDDPGRAGKDRLSVLKLNQSLKFNTGIYPYSVMLSTFLPVDHGRYPHAVKATSSIQDWCGQVFLQANLRKDVLELQQFSYFESEGDRSLRFEDSFLEDELWNLIRLAPDRLPTGTLELLPGTTYLRFSHRDVRPYTAEASREEKDGLVTYRLVYPQLDRELAIHFEASFPHVITGWEESHPGFGGERLRTVAERKVTVHSDYWNRHELEDRAQREALGLPVDWQ